MSPIVLVLLGSAGAALPMVAGLVVLATGSQPSPLARRSLLWSLLVGAVLMLVVGPREWMVEGMVEGRGLLEVDAAGRVVAAGALLCGAAALFVQPRASLVEQARYTLLIGSCGVLPLCADLIALVAILFLIAVAEAWFRRCSAPAPTQSTGPLLLAVGTAFVYGGLSTTSFAELSGRVSAVFTKWGGAMQFLGPLERDLPLPDGARTQFIGDVVTGAAPAMLTLVGMAIVLVGLLVAGRYVAAPARADGLGASANAVCRLAIIGPFLDVFVRGFGALRLVSSPYGWPTMLIAALGVGLVAAVTSRDRPRITALAGASTLMGAAVLLVLTQVAVARPFMGAHMGAERARLDMIIGFAVLGAVGVCLATIGLRARPRGASRPLAFALLGSCPPAAGAVALLAAASLNASPVVSACALASLGGCWWLLPAVARETRARARPHWAMAAALLLLFAAPLAPPVAAWLGL